MMRNRHRRIVRRFPPQPLTDADVNKLLDAMEAELKTPITFSATQVKKLIHEARLKANLSKARLTNLLQALNEAVFDYKGRLEYEQQAVAQTFDRLQLIQASLQRSKALLPDTQTEEVLFGMFCYFGNCYAAKRGEAHPGLPPFALEKKTRYDHFPFSVNFRSGERLQELRDILTQIIAWLHDAFTWIGHDTSPPPYDLSATVWLIGEELPKIYEAAFDRKFGITAGLEGSDAAVWFILGVLRLANINSKKRCRVFRCVNQSVPTQSQGA